MLAPHGSSFKLTILPVAGRITSICQAQCQAQAHVHNECLMLSPAKKMNEGKDNGTDSPPTWVLSPSLTLSPSLSTFQ